MSLIEQGCPDCREALHEIMILDQGQGNAHVGAIQYALPESKRSMWSGRFPVVGTVRAYLCEGCGRILLYGSAPDA